MLLLGRTRWYVSCRRTLLLYSIKMNWQSSKNKKTLSIAWKKFCPLCSIPLKSWRRKKLSPMCYKFLSKKVWWSNNFLLRWKIWLPIPKKSPTKSAKEMEISFVFSQGFQMESRIVRKLWSISLKSLSASWWEGNTRLRIRN